MPYLIETTIPNGAAVKREAVRPAHLAYLEANVATILAAGAKLEENGELGDGSFYLLDTANAGEAKRFLASDPYVIEGLVVASTIRRVRTGFFDRRREG